MTHGLILYEKSDDFADKSGVSSMSLQGSLSVKLSDITTANSSRENLSPS